VKARRCLTNIPATRTMVCRARLLAWPIRCLPASSSLVLQYTLQISIVHELWQDVGCIRGFCISNGVVAVVGTVVELERTKVSAVQDPFHELLD
jgi:hypothetical protein